MGLFELLKLSSHHHQVSADQAADELQRDHSAQELEAGAKRMPVLTPPLSLDNSPDDHSCDNRRSSNAGSITRLLDLFKGVGSDLTRFQVPVYFNMPKSQLQLYGELVYIFGQNLLTTCADFETPLERFLAVVRWHISSTRQPHFGKAPFNPILGETHHVSVGGLNVLLEQVSHHPPVTALHATDESNNIRLHFSHYASPRFNGSGVEVTVHGRRILELMSHDETYEMTSPKLGFRFLPVPGVEWTGLTTVCCQKTGFKASVTFKSKGMFGLHGSSRRVSGKVWNAQTGHTLYEIYGNWDQIVHLKEKATGNVSTLYDARAALSSLRTPTVKNVNAVSPMESTLVWGNVSASIMSRDFDKARAEKLRVEQQQRALRKERECTGTTWSPKFFTISPTTGEWEWQSPDQPVPPAPIVVPS